MEVLSNFLNMPDEAWKDRLVAISVQHSNVKAHTKRKESLTKGQLIQQHGYDEAMDMISRGKFQEAVDSDGDTVYVRSNQRFDHTTTKGTTVTSTRIVHLLRGRTLAFVDNK